MTQTTLQHHSFHLHGFSFQPVRILDRLNGNRPLYEFDYPEFMDVIDVFPFQSVVIRVRLDDRPRITDNRQEADAPLPEQYFAAGGARGRWLFHCHLLLHAALGMISEFVVLDADRDGDGFDTSWDCDDRDPNVHPLAEERNSDGVDNDCNGWVDDAPPEPRFERPFQSTRNCKTGTPGRCFRDP